MDLAASVLCDEVLCKFECQSDAHFLECDQYVLNFAAGCVAKVVVGVAIDSVLPSAKECNNERHASWETLAHVLHMMGRKQQPWAYVLFITASSVTQQST